MSEKDIKVLKNGLPFVTIPGEKVEVFWASVAELMKAYPIPPSAQKPGKIG